MYYGARQVSLQAGGPADPNRHTNKRKKLEEIVHWDGFKK
jgi:hypothetical protein